MGIKFGAMPPLPPPPPPPEWYWRDLNLVIEYMYVHHTCAHINYYW